MLEWRDLNNHQWNWNAGLNTPVCLSSPLRRLSLFVGPWVQRRGLIKAWLWFTLSDQAEETLNTELISVPIIQQFADVMSRTRCVIRQVWSPGYQSYGCYWSPGISLHRSWARIYFMIKSATGSNVLIVFTELDWRAQWDSLLFKIIKNKIWKGLSKWEKHTGMDGKGPNIQG